MITSTQTKENRKRLFMMFLVVVLTAMASITSFVTAILGERWASRKNFVAVSPNHLDLPYPFTYVDTYSSNINEDSEIKNFVYQYLKYTRDRSIISNYQSLSTDTRYASSTSFSTNILKSIDMTAPGSPEWLYVNDLYKRSNEDYKLLVEKKVSNHFLIHFIGIYGLPEMGGIRAVVFGQYENYFDEQKSPLPAEFLGGRVIEMIIVKGEISKDVTGEVVNPYGYYVYSTVDQFVDRAVLEKLIQERKEAKSVDF
ncbi:hypothetical protein [Bdellovibrio sp. BCCA]|uniref:hypothetical protein n=1 Tax=Bdellovibrio sp. BCCA TaxID=3136281 RepID=UPI0030F25021